MVEDLLTGRKERSIGKVRKGVQEANESSQDYPTEKFGMQYSSRTELAIYTGEKDGEP